MKTFPILAALCFAALCSCCSSDVPQPAITPIHFSDCHNNAYFSFFPHENISPGKSTTPDSISVTWSSSYEPMLVSHYNICLDCVTTPIVTTAELSGNTLTVVEHVGEQGLTNCFCFYDNFFQIDNPPARPFTLIIQVESYSLGAPHLTTVYSQLFDN